MEAILTVDCHKGCKKEHDGNGQNYPHASGYTKNRAACYQAAQYKIHIYFPHDLSVTQRLILFFLHHTDVGRTDDLIHVDKLFDPVGAPSYNSCDGKDRGE